MNNGLDKSIQLAKEKHLKNKKLYDENPKLCKCCNLALEYNKRRNSFCNSSCQAKVTNKGRKRSNDSKNRTSISLKNSNKVKISHKNRRIERINFTCLQCGIVFKDKINSNRIYCSNPCYHKSDKAKETHKIAGKAAVLANNNAGNIKRSKNEIHMYNLCKSTFSVVLHNEPIFNGWDADIIIPEYKLCILWNGNWHYKKITKSHSLEQVQNRDRIKIIEINKAGYIPYIIKDTGKENIKFVKEEFLKLTRYISSLS